MVSDTIYCTLLGASLLAWRGGPPMTRRKRSSVHRGRLSVDVGDMKEDIEWAAKKLGITVAQMTRDAIRAYIRRDDGGVSGYDLSELRLYLANLDEKFVRVRNNPADAQAVDELQEAFDWLQITVAEHLGRMPQ